MRLSELVKEYRKPRPDGHYVGLDSRLLDALVNLERAIERCAELLNMMDLNAVIRGAPANGFARQIAAILDGKEPGK